MSDYPCTSCGQCCRSIGSLEARLARATPGTALYDEIAAFPYKARKNGSCEKLGADGRCTVYETRPDLCDVAKTWEKHFKAAKSWTEFKNENIVICNKLIVFAKLSPKFLIDNS